MVVACQPKDAHQRGLEAGSDVFNIIMSFLAEWGQIERKVIDSEIESLPAYLDKVHYS